MKVKENKKLVVSLLISFIVIASFTGIIGYVSTSITKESINQLVGQQSTITAFAALNKIDISIANKISDLKKLGKESSVQQALILSNRSEQASENKIISEKLSEKISLENKESGYRTYENIILKNLEGKIIASSGNIINDISEETVLGNTEGFEVVISDVYYGILDDDVYRIDLLIQDAKGQDLGSLHASISLQEIFQLVDESRDESQFASSEFDLFYHDGFLLYSTAGSPEHYSLSDFVPEFEEIQGDINREFEKLDEQYEQILREFGYVEPELSDEQWEKLEEKFLSIDEKYASILEEYEYGNIPTDRKRHLEEQMLELDLQYDRIFEEYGYVAPSLSKSEQAEFDKKVSEIEAKYEDIYDKFDFDFVFGGKGFVIVDADSENEILHSYSIQRGYNDFEGFGWILVVHTEINEILSGVNSQRELLVFITTVMTSAAAVMGVFFSRIFYKQSQRINENEKMSTIGHLSSNIAHDMRNPLGAIRSSTERIKDQNKDQNQAISDEVKRINRSVKRMSHQIEGVLNYVRTTPLITDECSVLEMLRYAKHSVDIPSNVDVILPENDTTIECNKEKLEITFVNLMLNAIQAIDNKDDGTVIIKIKEEKNNAIISFENNGPEIPDDVLPRIFEPLFTTRLKGTGLGLSSCKNIIEQHKGKIIVTQLPATFTIHIPKKQKDAV